MLRPILLLSALATAPTAQTPVFTSSAVERLSWRPLGPANPMGRMTAIAIHPDRQNTWFVGTAGGGVFCTRNAGTTFECVFSDHGSASIGDVAIAPSDPDVVWVGTGEENARNSVQWGDGVYKSTDGGRTFTHMGLRETFQIGHIAIHPRDPDVVYVAALGRLWGENPERGVFRTRDGGEHWERVLHLDDRTGCVDVRLHPADPDTVFACLYERRRDRFDGNDPAVRFGEHAGLYKSIDGGENWKLLTEGLPTCRWGRSGIDILQSDPDTMFAIIETERSGWQKGDRKDRLASDPPDEGERGDTRQRRPASGRGARGSAVMGIGGSGRQGRGQPAGAVLDEVREGGPADRAGLRPGDRIVAIDDEPVTSYADLIEIVHDSRAEQVLKVAFVREAERREVEVTLAARVHPMMRMAGRPGGPFSGRLFGQLANKQKHQGELGYETGGVFRSDDRGETWRRLNSLTERPFYYSVIRVDPRTPDNIYCVGTTLWASHDGGEKFAGINRGIHVDFHAIWVDPDDGEHLIALCDGGVNETRDGGRNWQVHAGFSAAQYYDCAVDNALPYNVVGGLQDNGTWVVPSRTRYRDGITTADCYRIWSGDGFGAQVDPLEPHIVFATSQHGAAGIYDTRSGVRIRMTRNRPADGKRPRFNWDAPFILSPHNRLTVYHAGNYVFRGERHSHLDNTAARPDLVPMHDARQLRMRCISPRLGAGERGTATAIAESPLVPGLLYVGTDDGALWRTDDGGREWQRIDAGLPLDELLYVSDIVPSHFGDDRVYLTLDGHRSDDFRTHVFVSEDRGGSWHDLGETLPGT
ncbi:MAG TPA: PDZ domain-containing protein, partial [bacterium]|nr:PDZ domain-containing protein [bacterium]